MKNLWKRALALSLALVMACGALPSFLLPITASESAASAEEEVYDYSSMYRKEGLIFDWDASSFRPGIDVTALVNRIDRNNSLNVTGKTSTGKEALNGAVDAETGTSLANPNTDTTGAMLSESVIDFTSLLPYHTVGSTKVLDDVTIEVVLYQQNYYVDFSKKVAGRLTLGPSSNSQINASNYIEGQSNWTNNRPIDAGYGFIGDTYGIMAPRGEGAIDHVDLSTDVNHTPIKVFGNTRLETYSFALRFDYTVDDGQTIGLVDFDFVRDSRLAAAYDAEYNAIYSGNYKKKIANGEKPLAATNQVKFGGLPFAYRQIRVYTGAVSDEDLQMNHAADLLSAFNIDPARFFALNEEDREEALLRFSRMYPSDVSKEQVLDVFDKVILPDLDEQYSHLYVQDGLIYRWDGFDLEADGTSIRMLESLEEDGKAITRIGKNRAKSGIGTDGKGTTLANMYAYHQGALFDSVNGNLMLTDMIPWRDLGDVKVPDDLTLEYSMSYPSKYKTSPTATEKVSRTGHDIACMYFGPLGPIDYYKVNAGLTGGVGALVNEPTNPFTNWMTPFATLDNGKTAFMGSYPDRAFHSAVIFDYDDKGTDAKNLAYNLSLMRDGSQVFERTSSYSYKTDYSPYDGKATMMQLTLTAPIPTIFYSIRLYNRALTELEVCQNHTVDLFKYYAVDLDLFDILDARTQEYLYKALAVYQVGETSKEELEDILINFAMTGGALGIVNIEDYITFDGAQVRTDDYAALRLRYTINGQRLDTLNKLGARVTFGVLYTEKDLVSSPTDMTLAYNAGIGEFTMNAKGYKNQIVYHGGEITENLDFFHDDGTDLHFGLIPAMTENLTDKEVLSKEYYARAYMAAFMNGSAFVLYADIDENGIFGNSVSIDKATEYFISNGYATADIPSKTADPTLLAAAQAGHSYHEALAKNFAQFQKDLATISGAHLGAKESKGNYDEADKVADVKMAYDDAIKYGIIAATARAEINIYVELAKASYQSAVALASSIEAQNAERERAIVTALTAKGIEEEEALAYASRVTAHMTALTATASEDIATLAPKHEEILELEADIELAGAELRMSKALRPHSSLFLNGTTIARYTIITNDENLEAAKNLQSFFLANQGAFVGVYSIDNPYVSGMYDFSGENTVFVGVTETRLRDGNVYSIYLEGNKLYLEGKTAEALSAAASMFLRGFCNESKRIRLTSEDFGTSYTNVPFVSLLDINFANTYYPEIKVSSYDANGVYEAFCQSVAEKPVKTSIVTPVTLDRIPLSQKLEFFVAPNGDDEKGTGKIDAPFASLARALEEVRFRQGGVIYLRGGTYSIDETINIDASHSGTDTSPLYITAYNDEKVVFTTGKTIKGSAFKRVTEADFVPAGVIDRLNTFKAGNADNVYVVDLAALGFDASDFATYKSGKTAPDVYVGNDKRVVSRWPNIGVEDEDMGIKDGTIKTSTEASDVRYVGKVTAGISVHYYEYKDKEGPWELYIDKTNYYPHVLAYDQSALDTDNSGSDTELFMYGAVYEEWDRNYFGLSLLKDSNTGRHYFRASNYNAYGARHTSTNALYFYNMYEDLDRNDEFLLKVSDMLLYVYAEGGLADEEVTISYSEKVPVAMTGASHVILNGISFERIYPYAVQTQLTHRAVLQNCSFINLNGYAVSMEDDTQSGVINCYFNKCAGITTNSTFYNKLTPNEYFIQNNNFNNAPTSNLNGNGLYIKGIGNVVSHNYFDECRLYVASNYESIVEYNEFYRGSQFVKDNGPIYVGGDSNRGNHIRYNYFNDIDRSHYGIYLDDMCSGNYVYGNIFKYAETAEEGSSCIFMHGGNMNVITNNICLNATASGIKNVLNYYPQKIDGKPTGGGSGAKRWESIAKDRLTQNYHRIQAQYAESRYPMYAWYIAAVDRSIEQMDANPDWHYANKLSATEADEIFTRTPAFNIYTNNVFYNCNEGLTVPIPGMSDCIIEGNRDFAAGTDLGFLDAENGDYTLKEDSILFENGNFYAPDFSLMGATYEIHNSK